MKNKNIALWVLVILALILGFVGAIRPGTIERITEVTAPSFGAQSGQDQNARQYFKAGFQNGCQRYATSSTAATFTLTKKEIVGDRCFIDWTPNVNTTVTMMSTTTMDWLGKNPGDSREFIVRNASSTASATITLAEGTGSDFQKNEDTADLAIQGLDTAILKFVRKADLDVMIFISEFTEG